MGAASSFILAHTPRVISSTLADSAASSFAASASRNSAPRCSSREGVRHQELLVAGEDEPALSGLRILEQRQGLVDRLAPREAFMDSRQRDVVAAVDDERDASTIATTPSTIGQAIFGARTEYTIEARYIVVVSAPFRAMHHYRWLAHLS